MTKPETTALPAVNTSEMAQYLDRVERMEEEKKAIAEDIKDIWGEAKTKGYDVKQMRKVYSIRKMKIEERRILGLYAEAIGLFD